MHTWPSKSPRLKQRPSESMMTLGGGGRGGFLGFVDDAAAAPASAALVAEAAMVDAGRGRDGSVDAAGAAVEVRAYPG